MGEWEGLERSGGGNQWVWSCWAVSVLTPRLPPCYPKQSKSGPGGLECNFTLNTDVLHFCSANLLGIIPLPVGYSAILGLK